MRRIAAAVPVLAAVAAVAAVSPPQARPDWTLLQLETMEHFQSLLRMDTSDPPGNEQQAAEYLVRALRQENIPVETFARQGHRPNVVARLKANGHAALLHTTASPTMVTAGQRVNVIPSEATATIDVRTLPEEDPAEVLEELRRVVSDPTVSVQWGTRASGPGGRSGLNTAAFRTLEAAVTRHFQTTTLPSMSTGGTDMPYLRAKGIQCYGIGPAIDVEDGPRGFGAHSDQERILEDEL
jgi:acetylornithine deacetylase/succinyl-diaminopimelate desuccinylase-like protein